MEICCFTHFFGNIIRHSLKYIILLYLWIFRNILYFVTFGFWNLLGILLEIISVKDFVLIEVGNMLFYALFWDIIRHSLEDIIFIFESGGHEVVTLSDFNRNWICGSLETFYILLLLVFGIYWDFFLKLFMSKNPFKPTKNSIRCADLNSSWSVTDKEMNPSTEGADSNLQRFNSKLEICCFTHFLRNI